MANKKITELPTGDAPDGNELIEVVQAGVNKKLTTQQVANLSQSGEWGAITGNIADQTDLQDELDEKQNIGSTQSTGTVIQFDTIRDYGIRDPAETGNITLNNTDAVIFTYVKMKHNSGTEPTFGSEFKKSENSGNYIESVDNYIDFIYLTSTKIHYTIYHEAS